MILDRICTESKDTSDFLQVAREEGFVVTGEDAGKSIVVTDKKVYFSPISSITLLKRANFIKDIGEQSF
ncbi:extracellular matrix regulator RemB [Thermosediminibacter litoriperuensis]|nr:extracellular matrix/biofilm biosynthesis regulator RemA family protein [Thermosediminibacter litoriperuensis]